MSRATKANTLIEARKMARSGKPIVRKGGDYGFEDEIKSKAQEMRDKATKKLVEKRTAAKKVAPKVSSKVAKVSKGVLGRAGAIGAAISAASYLGGKITGAYKANQSSLKKLQAQAANKKKK